MANLKAIRIRIASVKSTKQITSAMKMVSAAKLRKAQDKIVKLRPYERKLMEILAGISQSLSDSKIELDFGRISSPEKVLLVVITSNRGLCGAFNANVIRETRRVIYEKYSDQYSKGNLKILAIGKKGWDQLRKMNFEMLPAQNELLNNLTYDNVMVLAEEIMNSFLLKEYDRVELVYNQFKNAAVQNLTSELFLPMISKEVEMGAVKPVFYDYIYEPNKEDILRDLVPQSLKIHFYQAVLDSYVAEHGARMTAMHKATDNATSMIRELTLLYNKARQATITNQILEVVSGAEALNG